MPGFHSCAMLAEYQRLIDRHLRTARHSYCVHIRSMKTRRFTLSTR